MKFSPNGKYFSVQSDKDFAISSSIVYKASCVGSCSELAWISNNDFITRDGNSLKLYKSLKEDVTFKPGFQFDSIFNGPFITLKSQDSLYFYDFETQVFINKIDVPATNIMWSESRNFLSILCEETTYILKLNSNKVNDFIEKVNSQESGEFEEGCEDSFEMIFEIKDVIVSGLWFEDVFIFINNKNKLCYSIENQIFPIMNILPNYFLLGYYQNANRLLFMSKNFNLISYFFPISFVYYQASILKKNFVEADKFLETIPPEYNEKVYRFLEKFEFYDIAYEKTHDLEKKFELAIKLKKLKESIIIASNLNSQEKWKICSDLAVEMGEFNISEDCMKNGKDLNSLFFYYSW